ncbi:MAG: hypothetical protein NZ805_06870 [Armatimonadetes bacterium]|nr:hypothetical protein [Armatimonadota bacterium]
MKFLKRNRILEGYPDKQIHLDNFLTRYEMAIIAYRILKALDENTPLAKWLKFQSAQR